ncbi:MTRF1L release factor glutamine methyltransferase-like [Diadema setosum]|uniref:MTRF1L release factor glutamine methyltransferase-like n=1 Tax=Diadema setosum TaxID=31175 RepID=UPI003B3AA048
MHFHRYTSSFQSTTSVSSAIKELTSKFEERAIPEADISAQYILGHVLGIKQLSDFERVDHTRHLSTVEIEKLSEMTEQKLARMPLQYILGEWEFRDISLKMRQPVFIPRPETEMLIDLVASHYDSTRKLKVLEVGCGSGAISIAILKEFEKAHVTAIDASLDAVQLTRENAEMLGVAERLHVHHYSLTEEMVPVSLIGERPRFDAIVSNPPYIFSGDMDDLEQEILRYEDFNALEAGPEGMSVITTILQQAKHLLTPGGVIWLETDTRHHRMIEDLLEKRADFGVIFRESFLDFTDRPRFCQLEYAP